MDEFDNNFDCVREFIMNLPATVNDIITLDSLDTMKRLYKKKCEGDEVRKCDLIKKVLKRVDHYDSLLFTKALEVWKDKTFDEVEEFYDSLCEIL